jgi:hypothetical protein
MTKKKRSMVMIERVVMRGRERVDEHKSKSKSKHLLSIKHK